jgi:4-hydroxybenzoate polyprenyltransferase
MSGTSFAMRHFHILSLTRIAQDTPEDLELGVFSTSILFGYEGSKRLVMPLTILYLCALAFAFRAAGLHWAALMVIPSCVLITEAHKVKMDSPVSCGVYARRALYAKAAVCATAALDLMLIQASVVM